MANSFGYEATLTRYPNWAKSSIGLDELHLVLSRVINSLDERVSSIWQQKLSNGLIQEILGDRTEYDVALELEKLRGKIDKSSADKLIERTLTLISFDGLNPVSIAKQNLLELYNSLNLTDINILPRLNPSSMANSSMDDISHNEELKNPNLPDFLGFTLYQDNDRRIKFHLFGPQKTTDSFDNRAHQHDGDSGSVILAGSVTNIHVQPTYTKEPGAQTIGVYRIQKRPKDGIYLRATRVGFADFERISEHTYKAGSQYFLTAAPEQLGLEYTDLHPTQNMPFHIVSSPPKTATLFTQNFAPNKDFLSTFPGDSSSVIEEPEQSADSSRQAPIDEIYNVICDMDRTIKSELSTVKKPSTIINRGLGDIVAERIYNPIIPKIGR